MKINRFVSVENPDLIHGIGEYLIGKDLPAGEYYFWGEQIWYTVTSQQGERNHNEYTHDSYASFLNGDIVAVQNGNFTTAKNITYEKDALGMLYPNHVYRVGNEIPSGCYLFKFQKEYFSEPVSFCAENDAAFAKSLNFPYQKYTRVSGQFGSAIVEDQDKYIFIKNGIAIYFGESAPDIYALLSSAALSDNNYHQEGVVVLENPLWTIKVFQKNCRSYTYHGDGDAVISEQYLYSINNLKFWAGFLNVLSFRSYHWIKFSVEDSISNKQYALGDEHLKIKMSSDISLSDRNSPVNVYKVLRKDFFEIRMPNEINMAAVTIKCVLPDGFIRPLRGVSLSICDLYAEKIRKLSETLMKYQALGLSIDVQKEIVKFESAPDFISICTDFLERFLNQKRLLDAKSKKSSERITFEVDATYDKAFYCAAKLADNAYEVQANDDATVYQVTFLGTQIEEISLMYSALATPSNAERHDMIAARAYLHEYDFFFYLSCRINEFIAELATKYGYSPFVTHSVLVSINKLIEKEQRAKLHILYNTMAKENRITTKWSTEYKLFTLVNKFISDAVYQYRADWLGQQSFDIFIPSQSIAIEYQGQQHYEAVDMFGGAEALENARKRDARKRNLSREHGVKILEWKYTVPVNRKNVLMLFSEHGIKYSLPDLENPGVNTGKIQMAPVLYPHSKDTNLENQKKKPHPFVIRQFNMQGVFLAEYDSIEIAAAASGVSEKSIRNTVYGVRKSGGSYIWVRCPHGSKIDNIEPVKQKKNTGLAKRVIQISKDGVLVAEYASIGQAAGASGVNKRSISDVLSGTQKTAGGYIWRYADE